MGTVKNDDVIQHDFINRMARIRLEPSSLGILPTDRSITNILLRVACRQCERLTTFHP